MNPKKATPHTIVGTGLIVLDITVAGMTEAPAYPVWSGGTCGNVLAILAFFGWNSRAVGRIGADPAGTCLLRDLIDCGVDPASLEREPSGTPTILHRVTSGRRGEVRHGYAFECPQCGRRYPSFRPVLVASVATVEQTVKSADVFFFDRVSRGILSLAAVARNEGALVVFEPSAANDEKQFIEAYELSDIVKYARDRRSKFEPWLEGARSRRRPKLEVETLGAEGLVYRLRGDRRWRARKAKEIPHLRDASGAGDWLTAGFLYAAARDEGLSATLESPGSVERALGLAEGLAAYNCQFEGPRGAMYATDVNANVQMLHGLDPKVRRKLTSEPKRPALQMTLTGICSACVAMRQGEGMPAPDADQREVG